MSVVVLVMMRPIAVIGACVVVMATAAAVVVPGLGAAARRPAAQRVTVARSATLTRHRRLARAFAERELGAFVLPPGATETTTDPAVNGVLKAAADTPGGARLIDRHRFWRVSGRPQSVLGWFKHHPPAATIPNGGGTASNRSGAYEWSVFVVYRHLPRYLFEGELGVSVAAATGGGTAVRLDSFATPLVPRPRWELVPRRARVVTVTANAVVSEARNAAPRRFNYLLATITDPGRVRRLIGYINSRQIMQPGIAFSCPALLSPGLSLRFSAAPGSPALATVGVGSCGYSPFALGRRHGPAIQTGDLATVLWRLRTLPACPASRLEASSRGVWYQTPPNPEYGVAINLRYTGTGACAVGGFPRVRLFGRGGRRLSTRVSHIRAGGLALATLLVPGFRAQEAISWSAVAACRAPRAHRIALELPRTDGWLSAAVGSGRRPVAPCHGRVTVEPVEDRLIR